MLRRNKGAMPLLMLNIFLAYCGYGLSIPVMPAYMDEQGLTGSTLGLLFAAFAVTQLAFSPVAGKWSDMFGRKSMIVGGLIAFSLSEWMFGAAHTIVPLYASRLLGGAGAAFMTPAVLAYVSDITSNEERAKGMSFINAAISAGFVIGPGLGGMLSGYGVRIPFYSAAAVGGVSALISLLILPDSKRHEQKSDDRNHETTSKPLFQQLSRSLRPPNRYGLLIMFVLSLGLAMFETLYGLFADRKLGFTPQDIAVIITGCAIMGTLVQITVLGTLLNRLGEQRVMAACLAAGGGGLLGFVFVHRYWAVLLLTFLVFLASDMLRPAVNTWLSKTAGDEQGFIAGMSSAYTSLGNVTGPVLAGMLFEQGEDFPYMCAGFILIACFALLIARGGKEGNSN